MAPAPKHNPAAVLLRSALLVGILAALAGLLGMHVLADPHTAHAWPGHIQAAPASTRTARRRRTPDSQRTES